MVASAHASAIQLNSPRYPEIESGLNYYTSESANVLTKPLTSLDIYNKETNEIERLSHDGFSINGITVATEGSSVIISNNTPRHFTEIAITDDINGFLIDEELKPFTSLTFESNLASGELHFMDPNTQFRSSPSKFEGSATHPDIESYNLFLSHLKQFYSKPSTETDFFDFF